MALSWRPGSGRNPSVDEALAYDDYVRQSPATRWPRQDSAAYAVLGHKSGNENVAGQQSLPVSGEGIDPPAFRALPKFDDLPKTAKGRQTSQEYVQQRELKNHGIRYNHLENRAGALLDRAVERSGGSTPEGRDFYARDEREKIARAAVRQKQSFTTMASMTAVTSPQVPWVKGNRDVNLNIAESVAEHANEGRPGIPTTETGLDDMKTKAREINDARGGLGVQDVIKGGPKVKSFEQNFLHPHHPEGRSTVDTHMVQAMAGIPEKKDRDKFMSRAGNYEMMDKAIRQAGASRGYTPEEAQSVAWHQQKYENESGGTGRDVHGQTMARLASTSRGQGEAVGQRDIFGGENKSNFKEDTSMYTSRKKKRDEEFRVWAPGDGAL